LQSINDLNEKSSVRSLILLHVNITASA